MTTNFITTLLEEKRINDVDWVHSGKYLRLLKNPPKIDNDKSLHFSEVLKVIIPQKLKECLEVQDKLRILRNKRLKLILEFIPLEYKWFYLELEAHLFKEYFVISKWNNYWLTLWDTINGTTPTTHTSNQVSSLEIEQAKHYPIENLYKGNLHKSGNRLTGLCPFHEEKHSSFFIFENNFWYCFGACSEGGDSINFLMKLKHIGFVDAVKYLNYGHN